MSKGGNSVLGVKPTAINVIEFSHGSPRGIQVGSVLFQEHDVIAVWTVSRQTTQPDVSRRARLKGRSY